jgi:hypothetical protein
LNHAEVAFERVHLAETALWAWFANAQVNWRPVLFGTFLVTISNLWLLGADFRANPEVFADRSR